LRQALKDIVKKALKFSAKREPVDFAKQAHGISQQAAREIMNLSRSVYRYYLFQARTRRAQNLFYIRD
jgi:hypothetical protein